MPLREVWCSKCLFKTRKRKESNVVACGALAVELDGPPLPNGSVTPSAVVLSSPAHLNDDGKDHFHPYFALSRPTLPREARDLNKRLGRLTGGQKTELSGLLRIPGTINWKHPEKPVVELVSLDDSWRFHWEDLDDLLPEGKKREYAHEAGGEPPVRLGKYQREVWDGKHPALTDDGEIDRSGTLFKIGCVLWEAGVIRDGYLAVALEERDHALWDEPKGEGREESYYLDTAHRVIERKSLSDSEIRLGEKDRSGLPHTYGENEGEESFSPESDPPHKGFGEKETEGGWTLPTKSLEQVIEEAGEETDWIIERLLARGELTVFAGRAKLSGKTTFWLCGIAASSRALPHAGLATRPARFLYLSEQGNNLTQALKDSGFIDPDTGAIAHGDSIEMVQFKDVSSVPWKKLVRESAAYAGREGFDALVVDTSATFTRLKGEQENQASEVGERVRTMRMACQEADIAGVLLRHSGKDGHGRGSSAYEDEADICVELTRPDGNHGPTVRKLDVFGRHGMWETNIQLRNRRFFGLGDDNRIEFNRAVEEVRRVLGDITTKEDGLKRTEIEERIDEDVGKGTLDRALTWLEEEVGEIRREQCEGRGRPYVYWRPDPLDAFSPNLLTGGESSGEKDPDEENSAYTSPNGGTSFSPEGSVGEGGEKEEERNGGYTPGMSREEFRALMEVWDEQSGPWGDPSEAEENTSEAGEEV